MYTMEYYSIIKLNEQILFAATWMDLEIIILCDISHRKTNIVWYHIYMEFLKIIQMFLFAKQKQTHIENKLSITKRGKGGKDNLEV